MKTKTILTVEKELGESLIDFLKREYLIKFRFLDDISQQLKISRTTLSNFMRENNIKIRKATHSRYNIVKLPNREEIAKDYLDKRMKMKELEKKWGIRRITILRLIKRYNLPLLKGKEKSKFKNRVRWLTEDEYQVILGSLLGDATLNKTNKSALFEEAHGIKQESYLLWKRDFAFSRFKSKISYEKRLYKNKEMDRIRMWTEVSPVLSQLRERLYPLGKKIVTKDILYELKPLGLAVWFMDDGSLNLKGGGDLSTDGFTKKENDIIKDYFDSMNIECNITKRKSGTYKIRFSQRGFINLINIISPYIHKSLIYKIDLNLQKIYRKNYYLNKIKINQV